MSILIDRPDVFLKEVHPKDIAGSIILERKFKRAKKYSRVSPSEGEKIARLSYHVPDIYFSVASYFGQPLLTNFANSRCLVAQFTVSKNTTITNIYATLDRKNFPLPTVVVTNGQILTCFWMLESSIGNNEFHKVFLLQHGLYKLLKQYNPSKKMLAADYLVPLPGTVNSKTGTNVCVIRHTGQYVNNELAEKVLLQSYSKNDCDKLELHSKAIHDLHALLGHRFLSWNLVNSCEDWLLFFGASLCYFCTGEQLKKELKAIAESLENKKWHLIKNKYSTLIDDLIRDGKSGFVVHDNIRIPTNSVDWFVLVAGKLGVEFDEVMDLGLNVITGSHIMNIHITPKLPGLQLHPVGKIQFIPVERLTLKEIA